MAMVALDLVQVGAALVLCRHSIGQPGGFADCRRRRGGGGGLSAGRRGHRAAPLDPGRLPARTAGYAVALLLLVYGYGFPRMADVARQESEVPPVRVAMIQPNTPQRWGWNPGIATQVMNACQRLTIQAGSLGPVDLIVWPGSRPVLVRDGPAVSSVHRRRRPTLPYEPHVQADRYEGSDLFQHRLPGGPDAASPATTKRSGSFPSPSTCRDWTSGRP